MKRICDISQEHWNWIGFAVAAAAGYAVRQILNHLRWASYTDQFWADELERKYNEEEKNGKDQGGEGQSTTQEIFSAPVESQSGGGKSSDANRCDPRPAAGSAGNPAG